MNVSTEHVEHKKANRLIKESSPYLLQHAYNPVDWFPWSQEAFDKARKENKPIFLSIGYSSCHWCHVMEEESFVDERIAKILNDNFVSVKVDREQRPDIDSIYLDAVTVMTGSAGWPVSVFLTADGRPFYGGTYFPPSDLRGMPGLDRVLTTIAEAWKNNPQELLKSGDSIRKLLAQSNKLAKPESLSVDMLTWAYTYLEETFDNTYGGFGQAPKFPQSPNLTMLLCYWYRTGNRKALDMVEKTLDEMAKGGICDQVGGGFHRYATDRQWLVPHFEKMLCDQALISRNYIEAYQVTGKAIYAKTARETLDYVLCYMKDAVNGFHSAEDADSEGKEGLFYIWSKEEIEAVLGRENAEIFNEYYGVTEKGNFHYNKNILQVVSSADELAEKFGKDAAGIENILSKSRDLLCEYRSKRVRPHKDDKIITSWNGLMISSLAYAGAVLGENKYINAAQDAADFVLNTLRKNGRLMRFYRDGQTVDLGFLDDYANFILALLDLYEATFDVKWLAEAKTLADGMISLFGDEDDAAFLQTGKDAEKLVVRYKPRYDGAIPSGNSTSALGLLKLGRLTNEQRFTERGQRILEAFSGQLTESPVSLTAMLVALDFWLGPSQEIIIAGQNNQADTKDMLKLMHSRFLPNAVLHFHPTGEMGSAMEKLNPILRGQGTVDGKAAAYICENYACKNPIVNMGEFTNKLREIAKV